MDVVDPINERQVPTQPMVKDHDSSMSYKADHFGIMSYDIESNDPAYRQSANRLNTTDIKQRVPAFWVQRRAFFLLWNSERMDQATARISRDNPTVNRELQANVINGK